MKRTILCIDDTQSNLFTLSSVIESMEGELYDVITSKSALEGLEVLLRQQVDIILLDVMMPDIDGFEAAKMIKSNRKTKKIPIIFLTAKKDDDSIERCYSSGGDDYINKPFNSVELLSRIAFHLKLKDKERLLEQEKEYVQSIIDLQENIIIVTDGKEVLNANSAFLNFFNFNTLAEFQNKYSCIFNNFLDEKGYFSLNLVVDKTLWIDEVIKLSEKEDLLVKLSRDEEEYIFNINAVVFNTQYIITLTDITQITQLSNEYEHEANFDALTEIYNRNMFQRVMIRKLSIAKKQKNSFIFMLLDIDYFKKVNDVHGHLVGDDILKSVAALIKKHIRENDVFARWGGEEFILVFDVTLERGLQIAESLRKHIEIEDFPVIKSLTCSFGITEYRVGDTLESLTKRADSALYEAKNRGRNKVCQA